MKVVNVHRRVLPASPERVGPLIDSLASPADRLWPTRSWPQMRLDKPLAEGAHGGHGPIGYSVQRYIPSERVRFWFTRPAGFHGWHQLTVLKEGPGHCVLEHRLEMETCGRALLTWPFIYRPLHDALIEDALTQAEVSLGLPGTRHRWSRWVHWLRRALSRTARRGGSSGRPHAV